MPCPTTTQVSASSDGAASLILDQHVAGKVEAHRQHRSIGHVPHHPCLLRPPSHNTALDIEVLHKKERRSCLQRIQGLKQRLDGPAHLDAQGYTPEILLIDAGHRLAAPPS